MKATIKNIMFFLLAIAVLSSCEPRVDIDMSQWGDNSELTNVLVYVYQFEDHELQEFQETGELTAAVRKQLRSTNVSIDSEAGTATVTVNTNVSLTDDMVVLAVQHNGTLVEPLGDSPTMGIPADLTTGPYTYRIHSAVGNFKDWVITVTQ